MIFLESWSVRYGKVLKYQKRDPLGGKLEKLGKTYKKQVDEKCMNDGEGTFGKVENMGCKGEKEHSASP